MRRRRWGVWSAAVRASSAREEGVQQRQRGSGARLLVRASQRAHAPVRSGRATVDGGRREVFEEDLRGGTDELALLQLKVFHPTIPLILSRKCSEGRRVSGQVAGVVGPDRLLHRNTTSQWPSVVVRPQSQQVTQKRRSLFLPDCEDDEIVAGDTLELVISAT